eukprot:3348610-Prorocentrum_lima.AAC.1
MDVSTSAHSRNKPCFIKGLYGENHVSEAIPTRLNQRAEEEAATPARTGVGTTAALALALALA